MILQSGIWKSFRNVVLVAGLAIASLAPAWGQTSTLLPNGMQQFLDANGSPLAGGFVFFYVPGTTTPKATWQDPLQTTLNSNPVVLDSAGRAIIYGVGQYRQVLQNSTGTTLWDQFSQGINPSLTNTVAAFGLLGNPTGATALATSVGIGSGLTFFGTNLEVAFPFGFDFANTNVTSAFQLTQRVATGPFTYTLPLASTLFDGFGFWIYAFSGAITVQPNSVDQFKSTSTAGTPITVPANSSAFISTNAGTPGTWLVSAAAGGGSTGGTFINVVSFGAVGNDTGNQASAIQNAINAACSFGTSSATVYFPVGTYAVGTGLTIPCGLRILGDGSQLSGIDPTVTTLNVFTITTINSVIFEKFFIQPTTGSQTAGSLLVFQPTTGENFNSVIRDVTFQRYLVGIDFVAASQWVIDDVNFLAGATNSVGVSISNTNNVDSGDSTITNSRWVAFTTQNGSTGILQSSSGGLRVVNNKINNIEFPYVMDLASGANTSDLIFEANSIENFGGSAILLERAALGTFSHVVINGNQFAVPLQSTTIIAIPLDPNGVWLSNVSINNNSFDFDSFTGFGVAVNSTSGLIIGYNNFTSNGGTSTRLSIGSTVSSCFLGPNVSLGSFNASTNSGGCATTAPF